MKRLLTYLGLITLLGLLAAKFWYDDGFHWTSRKVNTGGD